MKSSKPSMFQSLFFWMLLSKTIMVHMRPWRKILRFNPYFSGCFSLRRVEKYLHLQILLSFNPYFSGCFSLRKVSADIGIRPISSFNPYFSGCFSLRPGIRLEGTQMWRFNPYFSGCFSLRFNSELRCYAQWGFNPYFSGCFSLSRGIYDPLLFALMLFQSLFFWMLLSKDIDVSRDLDPRNVSILIFLDASL